MTVDQEPKDFHAIGCDVSQTDSPVVVTRDASVRNLGVVIVIRVVSVLVAPRIVVVSAISTVSTVSAVSTVPDLLQHQQLVRR